MTERQHRQSQHATPRKRALVSCDRCKLRRVKCRRAGPDEPCADCQESGVSCESNIPRKKRVYGSVETLSLRFRALEALVVGLFPNQNISETKTLFRIAKERRIPMPEEDDFTSAEIFKDQQNHQHSYPTPHYPPSVTSSSPKSSHYPGWIDPSLHAVSAPSETLIPTSHGTSLYFDRSTGFQFALTVRSWVNRCRTSEPNSFPVRGSGRPFDAQTEESFLGSLKRASPATSSDGIQEISDTTLPPSRKRAKIESKANGKRCKHDKHDTFKAFMPDQNLADSLLKAYFDIGQSIMPVLDRTTFVSACEATYLRGDEFVCDTQDFRWLCCLGSVFLMGAHILEGHNPEKFKDVQMRYLKFAREQFWQLVTVPDLMNVQTLFILSMYDHIKGNRNNAYIMMGIAIRIGMTIGLHRENDERELTRIERQTRKSTWWSLSTAEKFICAVLGRPSSIRDSEVSVKFSADTLLQDDAFPPAEMPRVNDLFRIVDDIKTAVHHKGDCDPSSNHSAALARMLLKQLDDWHAELPAHRRIESNLPVVQKLTLYLHFIHFYYAKCIPTRGFLMRKVEANILRLENPDMPPPCMSDEAFMMSEICLDAAHDMLKCIIAMSEISHFTITCSVDIFYTFHAVLIICSDFLARPKGHVETRKDLERKKAVSDVLRSTRRSYAASTYNMLSQIAFQFASITGVTDSPEKAKIDQVKPDTISILSPEVQPSPSVPRASGFEMTDPSDYWYTGSMDAGSFSSDFFDVSMQTFSELINNDPAGYSIAGFFVENPFHDTDDWTAKATM